MALDRDSLAAALTRAPAVVRVVIVAHRGSVPREAGTAMLVWEGGQSGTIGGGALEFEAAHRARALLAGGPPRVEKMPLGPGLGQCCGGAVTLVYERFTAPDLAALPESGAHARPITAEAAAMPLAIRRAIKTAREQGLAPVLMTGGWLVEPIAEPARALWIWGAGHVGRALVSVLAPLPDLALTWIDTTLARFPAEIPERVSVRAQPDPAALVVEAPRDAEHLILTFSHALDLDLCHRLLNHGFTDAGLIGSASKWGRFRSRLAALGHADAQIARIRCPIGDPGLGKHPQAIAIGVAAALLRQDRRARERDATG